ncbi:MAG: XdhC/CoxI family protein [Acidobacteriota bacterium]
MQETVFAAVVGALERGERAALVTIVATRGSTPQRVGAKMLVFDDGRSVGTIGGGCYEADATGKAREIIGSRKAQVVRYDLADDVAEEHGLICGGQMEVFIEPLDPSPDVYLIGAGHVSQHVATFAHALGFRVHVVDDRTAFANAERFPDAAHVVVEPIADWLRQAHLAPTAYVVIVTRGHVHDLAAMQALSGRTLGYVGMIGSRAKVVRIREALMQSGVEAWWLDTVRAPIGLRIGAVTPEEIALSIVAELVAVRRGAIAAPATSALSMTLPASGA